LFDLYDAKPALVDQLTRTGVQRLDAIRGMTVNDLAQPTPDMVLAQSQSTIGHHLQALVFHEGYHSSQLSAWRKAHGLPSVQWAFA